MKYDQSMLLAFAALRLLACGDSEGDGLLDSSGGTGASSGKAGGAGSATLGGASGSAAAGTAGAGGSSGKAGGGFGSGGSAAGSGGQAGGSADCLPPCLKALFDMCRPRMSCVRDQPEGSADVVECEAATGYRYSSIVTGSGQRDAVASFAGELCYTATQRDRTWTYYLPNGEIVGFAYLEVEGKRGRCPSLEPSGSPPVYYPVDTLDPRCASIECTPGTCP